MLKATKKYTSRGWRRNHQLQQVHVVNVCGTSNKRNAVTRHNSNGLASRHPDLFQ